MQGKLSHRLRCSPPNHTMKTLLLTLMLSPLAYADPKPPVAPLIRDDFSTVTVRPEKIASFRARATELNRRAALLEEESQRIPNKDVEKQNAAEMAFNERKSVFQRDFTAFKNDVSIEMQTKRTYNEGLRRVKAGLETARAFPAEATTQPPAAETKHSHASSQAGKKVEEVKQPVPSSVPGLPPGVEPGKKQKTDLPPGVSRTK